MSKKDRPQPKTVEESLEMIDAAVLNIHNDIVKLNNGTVKSGRRIRNNLQDIVYAAKAGREITLNRVKELKGAKT